jgi:excisionase family DNA binding protein
MNQQAITKKISEIEDLLKEQTTKPLSFKEACEYLGFSSSYLYKLTSLQLIPHYKPSGKIIYFSKEELQAWVYAKRISNQTTLTTKQ